MSWSDDSGRHKGCIVSSPSTGAVFGFRLKFSFFSVLGLIQALLIGLSVMFCTIIVEALEHWEVRKAETVTRFVESEAAHGTSRVTLAVLTIADNHQIAHAFATHDRARLLKLSEGVWHEFESRGIEQFEFSRPTARGMESFLRVHSPTEFGELNGNFRPLVVKCDEEHKLVKGLEQGRSGYAFRAVAPVFDA